MSRGPLSLGPHARAALRRVVLHLLRAAAAQRNSHDQAQVQFDYALDQVEAAMLLDAVAAERGAQDPH